MTDQTPICALGTGEYDCDCCDNLTPHRATSKELAAFRRATSADPRGPIGYSSWEPPWPAFEQERSHGIGLQDRDMANPMRSWTGALAGGRMLKAEMFEYVYADFDDFSSWAAPRGQ